MNAAGFLGIFSDFVSDFRVPVDPTPYPEKCSVLKRKI
jgi:hypothetical protein